MLQIILVAAKELFDNTFDYKLIYTIAEKRLSTLA